MPKTESQQTILAVDDDRGFLEMISWLLELENYDVLKADNGKSAIEIATKYNSKIRAILLDIMIPEISGLEVAEILGKTSETSKIPILLISANTRLLPEWTKLLHKDDRPTDYLEKPFEAVDLIDKTANLIKISKL